MQGLDQGPWLRREEHPELQAADHFGALSARCRG